LRVFGSTDAFSAGAVRRCESHGASREWCFARCFPRYAHPATGFLPRYGPYCYDGGPTIE
jgi:hypothetical protein